jgi:NAD(P)-dependent dehydrogenase (short-subunit alcohol dehydrogenase family)
MGRLDGKVAIVTGAASGMGRASASLFAQEGAKVVVADIQDPAGEEAVEEITSAGGSAVFVRTDVSKEEDIEAMVARAVDEFGGLNVIYNNAGIAGPVGVEGTTVEEWDRAYATIFRSVVLGVKHAAPQLRKAGGGSIISTSSGAGLRALPGQEAYSAMKAAIVSLTANLAQTLGPDCIRVNAIAPGWIRTPLLSGNIPGGEATLDQMMALAQPYPKQGLPEDIARTALFLASDESEFITGVTLSVDGGFNSMCQQRPEAMAKLAEVTSGQGLGWEN